MPTKACLRCLLFGVLVLGLWSASMWAQSRPQVRSLKAVTVPTPPDLARYVRDDRALVVLGKALFWDTQVSSDNRVACATCHFHAGADHRRQNQLATAKDAVALNWRLESGDFPFGGNFMAAGHRAGSAGVFPRDFESVRPDAPDAGRDVAGDTFPTQDGLRLRQVTRRNAPSVINAVFNMRNFWDGRASDVFTGWTPFGDSDTRALLLVDTDGVLALNKVRVERSSLASQAVGPALDPGEMSYRGRSWPWVGRKLLAVRPLALQAVSPDDSVLGRYVDGAPRGLATAHSYRSLVEAAFRPEYWRSSRRVDLAGVPVTGDADASASFSQAEFNFAIFFGLAIQA